MAPVLIWVKSYLRESGRKLQLVGIDLPNTLNQLRDDLAQLAEIIQNHRPPHETPR